jgi:hypothetical protein
MVKIFIKRIHLLLIVLPEFVFSQTREISDSSFYQVPFNNGQIVYEKVFHLDTVSNKDAVFNAAKSALIKNANYKYGKIDEDRNAGNISSEITFNFSVKPGIAKFVLTAKSILSIDIKENRFRVRIFNNNASVILLNTPVNYEMAESYKLEQEQITKEKWKASKSIILNWHKHLVLIIDAFGILIKKGINDDF